MEVGFWDEILALHILNNSVRTSMKIDGSNKFEKSG